MKSFNSWLVDRRMNYVLIGELADSHRRAKAYMQMYDVLFNASREQSDFDELREAHEQYKKEEKEEKKQRDDMTPRLRMSVLERDKFTCQLCGRDKSDSVRLQVDHKIPVTKGGKTEPANLWTLCYDCNQGKAARLLQ